MIKRLITDLKKYSKYIKYSTKSQLKAEVTSSYLSWIWLFLEPICFMLIYTFIAIVVFKSSVEYFPIFVFIGLTVWNFFSKTLTSSVRLVVANRDIVTKVYIPKFVLLITRMCVNTVKFFISFSLVIICMIIYQVPISLNVLWFIPLYMVLYIITFGISSIFMHFGVFVQDLANITTIGLTIALIITECRDVLLYKSPINYELVGIWVLIGLILSYLGIRTIYKYENTYVKVMR